MSYTFKLVNLYFYNFLLEIVFLGGKRSCNRIKSSQGGAPWNPRKEPLLEGCRGGEQPQTINPLAGAPPDT